MRTFSVYMKHAQSRPPCGVLVNAWTVKGAKRKWRRMMLEQGPPEELTELEVFEVRPRYPRAGWDEVPAR